jgi:hypothetical protein
MKHVSLDTQEEVVKQFVLSLSAEPGGSVLELHGRAVVRVLPILSREPAIADGNPWTEDKNARRCELVDREIAGTLLPDEIEERHQLQQEMLAHRRRVAPL